MDGAHDGSLSFLEIVAKLIGAGLDGYAVDYRVLYFGRTAETLVEMFPEQRKPEAAHIIRA